MAKLPKFTLGYDKANEAWQLKNRAKHVVQTFDTKADALHGGVLEKAVGTGGGSVQIRKTGRDDPGGANVSGVSGPEKVAWLR